MCKCVCAVRYEPQPDCRAASHQYDDEGGARHEVEERTEHSRQSTMPRHRSALTVWLSVRRACRIVLTATGSVIGLGA